MVKKVSFIALIIAALACGTWGYFYLQDLKRPAQKPFDVLPDSCSVLIEIRDPAHFVSGLTQGNLVWEEFLGINAIGDLNRALLLLDSLSNEEETREYLGNQPVYCALYGSGKTQQVVYAFNLSDVNESEKALAFFEKNFEAKKLSSDLYQCTFKPDKRYELYLLTRPGLFVISAGKELIDNMAAGTSKNSLSSNKQFSDSYKTAARDKGIGIFVHGPRFSKDVWSGFFSGQSNSLFNDPSEKWIASDLGLEPSDIDLQGFIPADSLGIARMLMDQQAGDLDDLYEHLPYHTFYFEAVNINDYALFCRDNYNGDSAARKNDLKKYSDSLSADAQTEIISIMGNFSCVFSELSKDMVTQFGMIALSDAERALSFLEAVADSTLLMSDSANLFRVGDGKLFTHISAGFFRKGFVYVSVINECAVFCNSISALGEYRRTVSSKNNFSNNERALQFIEKNFNTELNYMYYSDVFKNNGEIKGALSASLNKHLEEKPDLFEKFDAIGLSLQKLKGSVFYKAHVGFNPKNKMYQNTLWETLCDTDLYSIPVPMVNHRTGEKELLCQDRANTLYLVSNTGKILWKRNVKEKLLGEPVQVDYFANGKLQMLFASENYIHLVDRNGNYVQDFPVRIKAGASGGVSVFDYDGSKNYRLWLPLKNNTVVCLNTACKAVEGFVPVSIKAPLTRSIEHLSIQQKDYFIITDTAGNIYVTNRKGEQRAPISNKLPAGNGTVYFDVGKDISRTYICFVDLAANTLKKLSLTDKVETTKFSGSMEPVNYFFDTLQESGNSLVVLAGAKSMEVYDLFGKKITELKSTAESDGPGEALMFGDKKVYARLEKETGILQLTELKKQVPIENQVKLSALPASYDLIKGQNRYLVGFDRNKIFCIRP